MRASIRDEPRCGYGVAGAAPISCQRGDEKRVSPRGKQANSARPRSWTREDKSFVKQRLDCRPDQSEDGTGWIEIIDSGDGEGGLLLTLNGEIGRGSSYLTRPLAMLESWLRLGRISHGPVFRPVLRKNGGVSAERLSDKHVTRLVQKAAGLREDLPEGERRRAFSGHSLRAGLASSAKIEEAYVQQHLGHASAEMTRRYQRKRDRFKVNLTKAAGL